MTGSVQPKNGTYYAVLYYKDQNNKNKTKWIPTGYELKGNKRKAEALLPDLIEKHKSLEYKETDKNMALFTEAVKKWLENKQNKLQRSTYEAQTIYVNKHILPYFEDLKLHLHEVTPKHIIDYYEYKFRNGRSDGKPGGLNVQSIKKHSIILKQVCHTGSKLYRMNVILM